MDDLDQLIDGWARSRRMPDSVADRIRTEILAADPTDPGSNPARIVVPVLPAQWWRQLHHRTNRMVTGVFAASAA